MKGWTKKTYSSQRAQPRLAAAAEKSPRNDTENHGRNTYYSVFCSVSFRGLPPYGTIQQFMDVVTTKYAKLAKKVLMENMALAGITFRMGSPVRNLKTMNLFPNSVV